jgi:hypothetical protein
MASCISGFFEDQFKSGAGFVLGATMAMACREFVPNVSVLRF